MTWLIVPSQPLFETDPDAGNGAACSRHLGVREKTSNVRAIATPALRRRRWPALYNCSPLTLNSSTDSLLRDD